MAGHDSHFVCIIAGQMGIDEYEEVGDSGGEGESRLENGPGVRVGVEDDGEERGGGV